MRGQEVVRGVWNLAVERVGEEYGGCGWRWRIWGAGRRIRTGRRR